MCFPMILHSIRLGLCPPSNVSFEPSNSTYLRNDCLPAGHALPIMPSDGSIQPETRVTPTFPMPKYAPRRCVGQARGRLSWNLENDIIHDQGFLQHHPNRSHFRPQVHGTSLNQGRCALYRFYHLGQTDLSHRCNVRHFGPNSPSASSDTF